MDHLSITDHKKIIFDLVSLPGNPFPRDPSFGIGNIDPAFSAQSVRAYLQAFVVVLN